MDYLRKVLGMKSKDETPVPSKPPLTEEEINEAEMSFLGEGKPPSNKDIADKLERTIEEVNDVRRKMNERLLGVATTQPKANFFRPSFPRNQDPESSNFPIPYKNSGGRRTNKNKKKHKKLSRRRRHYHSKKNRKSMKRK